MTHSQRRAALGARLRAAELDALLVTDLINVRYLSGFTGSNAALLVFADGDGAVLATDGRYRTQAVQQAPDVEVAIERSCGRYLAGRAAAARAQRVGFESHVVTVDGYDALAHALGDAGGSTESVRASQAVEALREVKDAGEVALLRLACEAADAALADLVDRGGLRPGRTEREVGRELEALMLDHGADGVSFETIVAAGVNSAIPHHRPTDAVLGTGDFVKIDFGALVGGYHSDMTRTFVLGKAADWQLEIYELVSAAQRAGREALAAGATLADIDGAAPPRDRRRRARRPLRSRPRPRGGPADPRSARVNATAAGTLLPGSVVTVEPGVYLPDRGGVRIEDTLVAPGATPGHAPELLTRFPKELAIL